MTERETGFQPVPRRQLIAATLGTFALAALIVLGVVLPAEFNRDPIGFGSLSGLDRLWAPDAAVADTNQAAGPSAREYPTGFRSDVIEIPLGFAGGGLGPYGVEYKVRMKKGATLIYEWQAIGASKPADISYDFHGHTLPGSAQEKVIVASYKKAKGIVQRGALVAPFDGIQGWYFENSSDERPAMIRVKVSGFYDLVPAGEPGNEYRIAANVGADQLRAGISMPD